MSYNLSKVKNNKKSDWIKKHFPGMQIINHNQGFILNDEILISPTKNYFKPLGILDWAYFTKINVLCNHLANEDIEDYYETQLKHDKSHPNIWSDKPKEKKLKREYDQRRVCIEFANIVGKTKFHIINENFTYCNMPKTKATFKCNGSNKAIISNEDKEYLSSKHFRLLKDRRVPTDLICKRCIEKKKDLSRQALKKG